MRVSKLRHWTSGNGEEAGLAEDTSTARSLGPTRLFTKFTLSMDIRVQFVFYNDVYIYPCSEARRHTDTFYLSSGRSLQCNISDIFLAQLQRFASLLPYIQQNFTESDRVVS